MGESCEAWQLPMPKLKFAPPELICSTPATLAGRHFRLQRLNWPPPTTDRDGPGSRSTTTSTRFRRSVSSTTTSAPTRTDPSARPAVRSSSGSSRRASRSYPRSPHDQREDVVVARLTDHDDLVCPACERDRLADLRDVHPGLPAHDVEGRLVQVGEDGRALDRQRPLERAVDGERMAAGIVHDHGHGGRRRPLGGGDRPGGKENRSGYECDCECECALHVPTPCAVFRT